MHRILGGRPKFVSLRLAFIYVGLVVFQASSLPAESPLTYKTPPKPLVDLVDAAPSPAVDVDPIQKWLLILEQPDLASIEELAQPELRIGGLRINPSTNGASRMRYYTGLWLKSISGKDELRITGMPEKARVSDLEWSPNGEFIAFINTENNGQSLWVVELASKSARKLTTHRINSVYGSPFHWLPDSRSLVCKTVPEDRGPVPVTPLVPEGPVIQETTGKKAPARTYQDLLKNPHDETLFEYFLSAEVRLIHLDGMTTKIISKDLIERAEPSPDGKFLLVETLHRPFSYLVPARRFPTRVEIVDLQGSMLKQLADLPLAENVPTGRDAVPTGPRSFDWRDDEPSTVYWAEAQDGGNPTMEVELRDKIFTLSAPFTGKVEPLIETPLRYRGIHWGENNIAVVNSFWWQSRHAQTWLVRLDEPRSAPEILFDYSTEDRYHHPGQPLLKRAASGREVLLTDSKGSKLYLTGEGASPEGNRPFLDEFVIASKSAKRLWRSEGPNYETAEKLLDTGNLKILTRRESVKEPPNYFVRDLKKNKIV